MDASPETKKARNSKYLQNEIILATKIKRGLSTDADYESSKKEKKM